MISKCSRCSKPLDVTPPGNEGMTAGYYDARAWRSFTNPGEEYICDDCMQSDPRYLAVYPRSATQRQA